MFENAKLKTKKRGCHMENKEMSLTEFMKMYRDEKHKMVSISQSINAKERKIKVLKEE